MIKKMTNKIYLNLLIFCGIWTQGIIETFADEEIKESSDLLNREKRVINNVLSENSSVLISNASYIVNIRWRNRTTCVGSILSNHVVITISACVYTVGTLEYKVISASTRSDRGNNHEVIDIKKKNGLHPSRPEDGIALLTVNPQFIYGGYISKIQLHSEPLIPGTHGLIFGWGYNNCQGANPGTRRTTNLRSITVPIIAHRQCVNIYRPHNIEISEKDVCTYHPQRHCGHTDGGAPLVVDGQLAGIHLWTGPNRHQVDEQYPAVFVVLQDSVYNRWIRMNIRNIEEQFQNHHK